MSIYHFTGAPALSNFRIHETRKQLQSVFPFIQQLAVYAVYFVQTDNELKVKEKKSLMHLLQATTWDAFSFPTSDPEYEYADEVNQLALEDTIKPIVSHSNANDPIFLLVVPRIGTISPWSSKATDIAHQIGLESVKRIEHGKLYLLSLQKNDISWDLLYQQLAAFLHDPMTETVLTNKKAAAALFAHTSPEPMQVINMLEHGKAALITVNQTLGLALSDKEIDYLYRSFSHLKRNPTDVESMMFAQINSEHCRHKIFNSYWKINGKKTQLSLFQMIKNTYLQNPNSVLSAYKDNGAVLMGTKAAQLNINPKTQVYEYTQAFPIGIVIKVETHNHPTAISPFEGAATGAGGEIRDEGAVGRGAIPKAGLTGFSVSNLHIPGFIQPWETAYGKPDYIASALDIMKEGPLGAASFNNEFGRPNICGYFRTYEFSPNQSSTAIRGYHKPIMLAGGLGNIQMQQIKKCELPVGVKLVVLGGPAMLIGLGGGAASSLKSGGQTQVLDFASVQRSNAEMQRRCQEVIRACIALGEENPILSLHDVGAGGLSNAIPELLESSQRGGKITLRDIPLADLGLSPLEIWCNEAQERYVLGIEEKHLAQFTAFATRERCPFAIIGEATFATDLVIEDNYFENNPVHMPLSILFAKTLLPLRKAKQLKKLKNTFIDWQAIPLLEATKRVLKLPCVADKSFLIHIADRTVTGMVARDPMVGPWQVPVSDVAVTTNSYIAYTGEAMALGERAPIALLDAAASARMAVGEAITNIAAAYIGDDISTITLSANWMAAAGQPGEEANLYEAVEALGMVFCPALGVNIPVGKDSLSMQTIWETAGKKFSVTAPLSVVISVFAPVLDVRKTLTPVLQIDEGETDLLLIDLGKGHVGLGGSALAQVYQHLGSDPPDIKDAALLKHFFQAIQILNQNNLLCAYHDRSDGGLLVTLCEMAFASHVGLTLCLDSMGQDPLAILFSEALGVVIQIRHIDKDVVMTCLQTYGLSNHTHHIGQLNKTDQLIFFHQQKKIMEVSRIELQQVWSETSYRMQALRDNPDCAKQAFTQIADAKDPGLNVNLTFDREVDVTAPYIHKGVRPKVAILREQGVNGHVEMAAAFDLAGFTAVDVHMTDLCNGKTTLATFSGLVASGGFSYGDVLGAGRGWAQSILQNTQLRELFAAFFARTDTFTLGVCNGCQMLAQLAAIIPGTEHWPLFARNVSEQFESRLSLVEIQPSPSLFFNAMAGSRICMPVAHGEGRAIFSDKKQLQLLNDQVVARYVDHYGTVTENYPHNPNGSPDGIAGLTTTDGRVTIVMPHPERAFRTVQHSWHPKHWNEAGPTLRMFRNARVWVG